MLFPLKRIWLTIAPLALLIACGQNQTTQQQATVHHSNSSEGKTESPASATPASGRTHAHTAPSQVGNRPAGSIPDFTFYILKSGIRIEKSDLKNGNKHVFVLFDPGCTYCQHEARDIGKNLDKFPNTSFYFISMSEPALMATFFATYAKELDGQPNVHMLYDRNIHFVNKFHVPSQYPATYVYNDNQLLKTYWNGVKSAEEIIRLINE